MNGKAYDESDKREEYTFSWVGKRRALSEAMQATDKTLRPCKEESKNWKTTQNLYIEGDNLEALKLLQESYWGKVKMIYIDPPYNTGNDFIFVDNFTQDAKEYEAESGIRDEDGERMRVNHESDARFHSIWCSMIYARLRLARNLLTEDGVIFISIDDNEVADLRKICDEIFGESNLVSEIPWQSRASIQNDTDFSVNHEYICVYAKSRRQANRRLKEANFEEWHKKNGFVCKPLPMSADKFDNPDNDPRGKWKADPFDAPNIRPNLTYAITNPNTGEQHLPPRGRCWRFSFQKFSSALKDNRIVWSNKGKGRPQLKVFYDEKKELGSIENSWFNAEKVGTSTSGTKEFMHLFDGKNYFDSPKPTSLLRKLITLANTEKDSIILDFFSGSATTAHAVMQLNAEDGGHRKFILVQLPEKTDEKSEAFKEDYKNICEIGKERIRRAGEKIRRDFADKESAQNLDTGFRVFKIASSNLEDVLRTPSAYTQETLSQFVDNIKSDRTDLDLLFMCLLRWGMPLDKTVAEEICDGTSVLFYDENKVAACFAKDISQAVIRCILAKKPQYVAFADRSFVDSAARINAEVLFQQLSPTTDVWVI